MKKSQRTGGKIPGQLNISQAPEQTNDPLIINKLVFRNVDRTPKDVGNWRDSHRAAENVYYPNRTRLYDLYDDVELDGHLTGIWGRRVSAAVNKKYVYVDKNKKPVEAICDLIKTTEFRDMMKEMMKVITWSSTGFEFLPGAKFAYKLIPRKHIKPEKKVIAINQTDNDGIPYEPIDNLWVLGKERDLGLLLKCAFYVLLKKGDFSDWANYIEIFGQPLMVTKYDTYDEKTKAQLTKMMEEAGASLRLSIPKQADFEIMDGKTSNGNGDLQSKFKDACNDELSVLVLTVTETTKSSKSSGYAQSNTHAEQQFEVTIDDVQFLLGHLNSDKFKAILKSYGFDVDGGCFMTEEQMHIEQQLLRVQVIEKLKGLGLPIDDDYLYETFGIPKPANYNELKAKQEAEKQRDPALPEPPENKPDPEKGNQDKKLTRREKLMLRIADFFVPARKD